MKNALIRFLTLTLLATSLSSLAAASERKSSHQQSGCASADEQRKNDNKEKKTGDRSEQEREFDRVLMAIYG